MTSDRTEVTCTVLVQFRKNCRGDRRKGQTQRSAPTKDDGYRCAQPILRVFARFRLNGLNPSAPTDSVKTLFMLRGPQHEQVMELARYKYLTVRPEPSRRAPIESSHSLPL